MTKLLIAEDEPKTRDALVCRLRGMLGEQAIVDVAADGNEAVEKALQIKPDLLLLDIEMPFKTGLEVAAIVKEHMPQSHVVFLTAYDRFDYARSALRTGAEDYLLKPVSERELKEMVQKHLGAEIAEKPTDVTPFETSLNLWVRQHYAEELTLETAAEGMGMSPFYFSRKVKAATGKTFLEYLILYRMEKAKTRLRETDLPIADVGRSVGYGDANYFAKAFKRTVGCAPSVYRSQNEGTLQQH